MSLIPSIYEKVNRARSDLRMGLPVVFHSAEQTAMVVAVETLTKERFSSLKALGNLELALTQRRASTLKVRVYDNDLARISVPQAADIYWLKGLVDPADDLTKPMKGPLVSIREGSSALHRAALALIKSSHLLPAALLVQRKAPGDFANYHSLTWLNLSELEDTLFSHNAGISPVVCARVPIEASQAGKVHIFRPTNGTEEHYAIQIGQPNKAQPLLLRLHSACFTGDILGSLKCDCGAQLRSALKQMGQEGSGILLYLNQEGRGIGLANKMRAYALQDHGFDTVEANHRLGFEDDERDFEIAAQIMLSMGYDHVRLMTNNPNKVKTLENYGIKVTERVPLKVGKTQENTKYLATKAKKSGHFL